MNDREKIQKAFNHCSDALISLDQKSILKVFHLLSVHFDIAPAMVINNSNETNSKDVTPQMTYLSLGGESDSLDENNDDSKKVNKKYGSAKKGKSSINPTYLSDFDFQPFGQESLKDFSSKYKTSSNQDLNLIFIYYLQQILGTNEISINHIYSCYRHLGLKIPAFPQTLNDTRRYKGWIDTSNTNDLKITRAGINFLEHDMPKNNGDES